MTLSELKQLMGIAAEDTTQDAILSLYLESALDDAKTYADKLDWTTGSLPGAIKLGIVRWAELAQVRKERSGIQSESIGGMSQTFLNGSGDEYFSEVYDFWKPYHTVNNGLVFRTAKHPKPRVGYI
ncbi:hypothetical protein ABE28_008965 [Peribacillus muralis]|uniref:Phage head-tail adapter protein n=1 Tax=Peribacillus muralis TaxID=264697 RepID=A0A1B3XMM6_9BACI|nr:phage head-tail connector protein [Peribacillus muralis]AOH54482.1 hypothetical protein ABE28_008965 [Peribacillus muralis]